MASMITALDIAWLAGLIEGEGCIYFRQAHPQIKVQMTDLDVIQRVSVLWGNARIHVRHRPGGLKTVYSVGIGSTLAIEWIMTLYSFMHARRRATMKAGMAAWRTSRGRARDRQTCPRGHAYDARGKNGARLCSICNAAHKRAYRARLRLVG